MANRPTEDTNGLEVELFDIRLESIERDFNDDLDANAFAVELNVSKTNSANPSPGTGTSVVALLGTKDSTGAELYRGANQLLRRSKIHLSDQ